MKTIKKLSQQESQKIAAGEVVERPSNIVKELIENALDAHATALTVRAQDGGKHSLSITDNGDGMSKEDLLECFKRHTTSKITSVTQLDSIETFGFRGEALASICSIAKVTIISKQKKSLEGTRLILEDGEIKSEETVGCSVGTTISISSLFYNVPARRKFLKTTSTEWNHILTLFKAYALNNNDIHFTLEHEGVTAYNCPAVKTVKERVEQLFDPPLSTHTLALTETKKNDISVSGVITNQQYARYDRGGFFFFVNKRWVKNYQLANAATKGYLNLLPQGRYPAVFISLTVNPQTVDVNVHPKKEEVQFLNPKIISSIITLAVKTTLENYLSKQLKQDVRIIPTITPPEPFSTLPPPLQYSRSEVSQTIAPPPSAPFAQPSTQPTPHIIQDIQTVAPTVSHYKLIGQYKQTYLLLEHTDGLFVIDQHAAHERILYERFAKRFKDTATVNLLFPQTITLASQDLNLIKPYLSLLEDFGVACEPFSETDLVIKATPVFLKNQSLDDVVKEMIGWIKEENGIEEKELFKKLTERLRAQMACKAAVKAGDVLSQEKMEQLLNDLESTENRFTCPHGRPTSWLLSVADLEKKFKRRA